MNAKLRRRRRPPHRKIINTFVAEKLNWIRINEPVRDDGVGRWWSSRGGEKIYDFSVFFSLEIQYGLLALTVIIKKNAYD